MTGAYKPAAHIAWRRVEDEVVVLELGTSVYYSLDEVGARIWELLAEGHPAEKTAEIVAREYGEPVRTVRRDVADFLAELSQQKLIEPAA